MRGVYTFNKRMNDGLVGLLSQFGRQLWIHVKLRKNAECAVGKCQLAKGTTVFSPLTNDNNRMERICVSCVDKLEKAAGAAS